MHSLQLEQLVRKLDMRVTRIEQLLPTLATKSDLQEAVARLATSTGQWPEAIHPRTKGGCMGDGQHVWAAAEWVLLLRNMFVREEGLDTLVLCSGIPPEWLPRGEKIFFGPARTDFGEISLTLTRDENIRVSWRAKWHDKAPILQVGLLGSEKIQADPGVTSVELRGPRP